MGRKERGGVAPMRSLDLVGGLDVLIGRHRLSLPFGLDNGDSDSLVGV